MDFFWKMLLISSLFAKRKTFEVINSGLLRQAQDDLGLSPQKLLRMILVLFGKVGKAAQVIIPEIVFILVIDLPV